MNAGTLVMMAVMYALFVFSEVLVSKYLTADWMEHSIAGSFHKCVAVSA
jgi:hypothetical protein